MSEKSIKGMGFFILSLDTELASGYFDADTARARLFSKDGVAERARIRRILKLFESYGIRGTWAVVGHLFFERCAYCDVCLLQDWKGKYKSYDEAYGTSNPLWYGSDIVRMIQDCSVKQEVGFHGQTHAVFTEGAMSENRARLEITEWKRLARQYNITAKSVVFPRNRPGHLALLREEGFTSYRVDTDLARMIHNIYLGKVVKTLDHIFGITTAPTYPATLTMSHGLVSLRASQQLFGFNRVVDRLLDKAGMALVRVRRILRAVERAARYGKILHLWAHPWEFETSNDLRKLETILSAVQAEQRQGRIRSVGMSEMADILRSGVLL